MSVRESKRDGFAKSASITTNLQTHQTSERHTTTRGAKQGWKERKGRKEG